jgi:transposase
MEFPWMKPHKIMKTRSLTTEEKSRIIGMSEAGLKGVQIAKELGHPTSTVYTVLKNFRLYGTVVGPKPTGAPRKLSERDARDIVRTLKEDRRQTLADITNKIHSKVSTTTVRRALRSTGYFCRVAARKPFLNDRHKAARLAFAKKYRSWTFDDWKKVIWTDESTFEIGKNSRHILVWRKNDERFKLDCLAPSFKSGRSSIMVWGAFTATQKIPLVRMPPGRRTAVDFVEIVYDGCLGPFLSKQDEDAGLILMEDGAPVHRSKVPKNWRERKGIEKLVWPANSPDLNPIENIWMILKDGVQKKHRPKDLEDMWSSVEAEWIAIPYSKLESLVVSMPTRIEAVLAARGGETRY